MTEIGINFWKADERTTTFSIAVANDAAGPFTTVINSATSAASGVTVETEQLFNLEGTIGRYVKFIGIGNSSATNWTSIANVNIYGDINCEMVFLDAKLFLGGPFDSNTNLMNDDLRANSLIPMVEPYSALGILPVNHAGGETIEDGAVLTATGNTVVVDWVFVELCDKNDPATILASRSGLLHRDGSITDVDGSSSLLFDGLGDDDYYVAIRHRNHLRVRSSLALSLSRSVSSTVDFTSTTSPITLTGEQKNEGGTLVLWSGDCNSDNSVNAADRSISWNDRNQSGYLTSDNNMDGYTNAADRSICWNNRNKVGIP